MSTLRRLSEGLTEWRPLVLGYYTQATTLSITAITYEETITRRVEWYVNDTHSRDLRRSGGLAHA